MKVLVTGHWYRPSGGDLYTVVEGHQVSLSADGCEDRRSREWNLDSSPASLVALQALRRGMVDSGADVEVDVAVFGAGRDFVDTVASASASASAFGGVSSPHFPVSIPAQCGDAFEVGAGVSQAVADGHQVVVEAGHVQCASLWESFLTGALGIESGRYDVSDPEACVEGLVQLRQLWRQRPPVMAVSTQRPFVGLSSALAVTPDMQLRDDVDPGYALVARQVFDRAYGRNCMTLGVGGASLSPATVAGSGAGGGIGALMVAIGAKIVDSGQYLSAYIDLAARVEAYDLIVVLEPELHSVVLAEAQLDALTSAAGAFGLPVVAVGADSSLSRHELAQWGLHGVMLSADNVQALTNIGMRLAHTWARRVNRL